MIGREWECSRIDGLLRAALAGEAGVLELEGEPGVGKTELCEYAVAEAHAMRVLRVTGVEFESDMPLTGLFDLVRPLGHRLARLPEPQRLALRALLDGDGRPGVDLFALAAAVLSLLSAEAEEHPVLVVVDDTHWLDDLSGQAMSFAFRRLQVDAVAVLLAARKDTPGRVRGPWETVQLSGLSADSTRQLLDLHSATPVAPAVAGVIAALTGGNPLAVIEAVKLLKDVELAGTVPLPDPLPLGTRGTSAFGRRIQQLPAATREALTVVAAAGQAFPSAAAHALRDSGFTVADLAPAEHAEVVTIEEGVARFVHPLFRSAVFATADSSIRRQAHTAVAHALVGLDQERSAWHLAAAATGPSEEVAATLDEAAATAARRAGPAAAAASLSLAAQLSPPGPARTRRLASAGEALFLAGRRADAYRVIDDLLRVGDVSAHTQALLLEATLLVWTTSSAHAPPRLHAIFEELAVSTPESAAIVGMQLAVVLRSLGKLRDMVQLTARLQGLPLEDGPPRLAVRCTHALASLLVGDPRPLQELERQVTVERLQVLAQASSPALATLTQTWVFAERLDVAAAFIDRQVHNARARSAPSLLPFPLAVRCDLGWRRGALDQALADAEEALVLGEVTGYTGLQGYSHAVGARVAAVAGNEDSCRQHAALAREIAARAGHRPIEMYVNHALGLLELGRGQPAAAAVHLEANREVAAYAGLGSPAVVPWKADHVEALIGAGDRGRAVEVLEELEREADNAQSPWGRAASLRCRALLGEEDWESLGDQAVSALEGLPIEQARAHSVLGERLRRARRPREARAHFDLAVRAFRRAGAVPWAERAERELRSAGGSTRTHTGSAQALSSREYQVCRAAADGAANKDIAAALFISPKTVEYHLNKAFMKLGVTNRTQAARILAQEPPAQAAPPP